MTEEAIHLIRNQKTYDKIDEDIRKIHRASKKEPVSGGRGNFQLGSKRKKDNDHDHIHNGHGKDETDKVMNTEHNVVDNVSNDSKKERNPD